MHPLASATSSLFPRQRVPANFLRYFNATSNSFGKGASITTGSRVTGCFTVNRLACSASRLINGFSSGLPL